MIQFRCCCVTLLLISANFAYAESLTFMKAGSLFCLEKHQSALSEIVDAESKHELKEKIVGAVLAGSCIGSASGHFIVSGVVEKKTPSGNNYYCFNFLDSDGEPEGERECSTSNSLATVAHELKSRSGDYEIAGEGPGFLKALCKEGGYVLIDKGVQWTRWSRVLPALQQPDERPISKDKDREIRDGCKGVDYKK